MVVQKFIVICARRETEERREKGRDKGRQKREGKTEERRKRE